MRAVDIVTEDNCLLVLLGPHGVRIQITPSWLSAVGLRSDEATLRHRTRSSPVHPHRYCRGLQKQFDLRLDVEHPSCYWATNPVVFVQSRTTRHDISQHMRTRSCVTWQSEVLAGNWRKGTLLLLGSASFLSSPLRALICNDTISKPLDTSRTSLAVWTTSAQIASAFDSIV